jgi:hypothetical protein
MIRLVAIPAHIETERHGLEALDAVPMLQHRKFTQGRGVTLRVCSFSGQSKSPFDRIIHGPRPLSEFR